MEKKKEKIIEDQKSLITVAAIMAVAIIVKIIAYLVLLN